MIIFLIVVLGRRPIIVYTNTVTIIAAKNVNLSCHCYYLLLSLIIIDILVVMNYR